MGTSVRCTHRVGCSSGTCAGAEGPQATLAAALGRDLKGKLSPVLYFVAIMAAFVSPWIAGGIYALMAAMWPVPDLRIERVLGDKAGD